MGVPRDQSANGAAPVTFNLLLAAASTAVAAILWQTEIPAVPLVVAAVVLAFLLVVAAVVGSIRPRLQLPYGVAWGAAIALLLLLVIVPTFLQVAVRHANGDPARLIHDGALQVEEAVGMLDAGRNPYRESFRGTDLERWGGPVWFNPAVDHLVYPPGYLILADATARFARPLAGFYDDRFLSFSAFLAVLAIGVALAPSRTWKLRAAIGIGLNPLMGPYLVNGRNDAVVVLFLAGAFALLSLRRPAMAAAAFGVALTVKTNAALLLPAFLLVLLQAAPGSSIGQRLRARWVPLLLLVAVTLAIYLPFAIWDGHALYDDLVRYPTAGGPNGYPINGGGIAAILRGVGVIHSDQDPYPFWILQLVAVVGTLAALVPGLRRRPTAGRGLGVGTTTLFAGSYTARFFTENHVGLIGWLGWFTAVLRKREQRP